MDVFDLHNGVLRRCPLVSEVKLLRHGIAIIGVHQTARCAIDQGSQRGRDYWIRVDAVTPTAQWNAGSRDLVSGVGNRKQTLVNRGVSLLNHE